MRTTIEIPPHLRQRLVAEAAERNLKGFSPIIVKALNEYFEKQSNRKGNGALRELRGSLSEEEYEKALKGLEAERSLWRV
jgi:metal-responsive CopG/Arc/MetJ family transcriptional regulator